MNKADPVIPNPEKVQDDTLSPMDPPEVFNPPSLNSIVNSIDFDKLDPFLKELVDDHKGLIGELNAFEKAFLAIMGNGITVKIKEQIRDFFEFFDHEFILHNQKEEYQLFPILKEKLLETGEHSIDGSQTPIDILTDDHIKALQLAAVSFNLFSLITKLEETDILDFPPHFPFCSQRCKTFDLAKWLDGSKGYL